MISRDNLNTFWVNTSEGVLILNGTPFRIEYRGDSDAPFHVYRDSNLIHKETALCLAKGYAIDRVLELVEMGIVVV